MRMPNEPHRIKLSILSIAQYAAYILYLNKILHDDVCQLMGP